MRELAEMSSKTPTLDLAVLTALNIAQELIELQKQMKIQSKKKIHQAFSLRKEIFKIFKIRQN